MLKRGSLKNNRLYSELTNCIHEKVQKTLSEVQALRLKDDFFL